jgi:hypothetical protein
MRDLSILWPALALVFLTFLVWVRLYLVRRRYMIEHRINPQKVATRSAAAQFLAPVAASADNFQNLFELPVLFYALIAFVLITGMESQNFTIAAWVFVAARAAHSYIHCTYNRVMHRFAAYAIGGWVLFGMWAAFAVELARRAN